MDNKESVIKLIEKSKENVEATWNNKSSAALNECFSFAEDIKDWVRSISAFDNNLLVNKALDECVNSLIVCTQGYYKGAIFSLRQFLEHFLFAIYLSSNDLKYRLWKLGRFDMSWKKISSNEEGVFSKDFIDAYAYGTESIDGTILSATAQKVYRECSEFVHGNYEKLEEMQNNLLFNEKILNKYIEYYKIIEYIVSVAMFIRFYEVLKNDRDVCLRLETILTDNLGHLREVQDLYSMGVEE